MIKKQVRYAKKRNDHHDSGRTKSAMSVAPVKDVVKSCTYYEGIKVSELASKLHKNASDLIKVLFMLGSVVTINSVLTDEQVSLIALQYNCQITKEAEKVDTSLEDEEVDDPKNLVERPPIVTIMGHVDHGKTTLLDTIRKTNVASGEVGGITQKIGAYQVEVEGKKVTFLDTPGHEAFTAMRARGASVTDTAIIVVAADDGLMPQTLEAIDHAKAAKVPIIIAINKIDLPHADPQKIMYAITDLGLTPEEWGGNTIVCQISAKSGLGVKELLKTILVVAEMQELKANPNRLATGTVIEAKLDKGKGPLANILVQNGTLHTGDIVVIGACYGKIRRMYDDKGREIKAAGPSTPVSIIGLSDVPESGDHLKAFANEHQARLVADKRKQAKIEKERNQTSAQNLDDLTQQVKEGKLKEINLIIKADNQGSAEAMKASMEKLEVSEVRVNVIHATPGAITESDIMLAAASNAIIYGFNIRPDANIRKKAEEEHVTIRLHDIIYKALEEMELTMKGMKAPVYEEVISGQAEVRHIFKVSKIGTIAGCMVTDGSIKNNNSVRLIRDGIVIYTGQLGSLKRFKDDSKEVTSGFECGITIKNFNDIKEGDIIEGFNNEEVKD